MYIILIYWQWLLLSKVVPPICAPWPDYFLLFSSWRHSQVRLLNDLNETSYVPPTNDPTVEYRQQILQSHVPAIRKLIMEPKARYIVSQLI